MAKSVYDMAWSGDLALEPLRKELDARVVLKTKRYDRLYDSAVSKAESLAQTLPEGSQERMYLDDDPRMEKPWRVCEKAEAALDATIARREALSKIYSLLEDVRGPRGRILIH